MFWLKPVLMLRGVAFEVVYDVVEEFLPRFSELPELLDVLLPVLGQVEELCSLTWLGTLVLFRSLRTEG